MMKIEVASMSPGSWAFVLIQLAWVVTGVYFIASIFFTNRIKRRDKPGGRLLDMVLLWGGYILLFSQIPLPGFANQHFVRPRETLEIVGVVLTYLGLSLVIWSRLRLGRYWSGVVALKQDHKLIQAGPYRVVRHPLYSGIILAALGMVFCVTMWTTLLGFVSLMLCFERRAHKEDTLLATEFGAEFERYRQRTGRLLPRMG